MSDTLTFYEVSGEALVPWLDGIGKLRIAVFREYPYLYDGSLAYEFVGFAGPDAAEGLASHTEKRAPRFDGPTGE